MRIMEEYNVDIENVDSVEQDDIYISNIWK